MDDGIPQKSPHRLKLRLPNGAEFEAEGSEATVEARLERLLAALEKLKGTGKPPGRQKMDSDQTHDEKPEVSLFV